MVFLDNHSHLPEYGSFDGIASGKSVRIPFAFQNTRDGFNRLLDQIRKAQARQQHPLKLNQAQKQLRSRPTQQVLYGWQSGHVLVLGMTACELADRQSNHLIPPSEESPPDERPFALRGDPGAREALMQIFNENQDSDR